MKWQPLGDKYIASGAKKTLPTNLNVSLLSTTCNADVAPQPILQKWKKEHWTQGVVP
jgi:hypothetical protein